MQQIMFLEPPPPKFINKNSKNSMLSFLYIYNDTVPESTIYLKNNLFRYIFFQESGPAFWKWFYRANNKEILVIFTSINIYFISRQNYRTVNVWEIYIHFYTLKTSERKMILGFQEFVRTVQQEQTILFTINKNSASPLITNQQINFSNLNIFI